MNSGEHVYSALQFTGWIIHYGYKPETFCGRLPLPEHESNHVLTREQLKVLWTWLVKRTGELESFDTDSFPSYSEFTRAQNLAYPYWPIEVIADATTGQTLWVAETSSPAK
jgi:hypothetical protein